MSHLELIPANLAKDVEKAVQLFGTYVFYDKGAYEALSTHHNWVTALCLAEPAKARNFLLEFLKLPDPANIHANIVGSFVVSCDEQPDDWFDIFLNRDDKENSLDNFY